MRKLFMFIIKVTRAAISLELSNQLGIGSVACSIRLGIAQGIYVLEISQPVTSMELYNVLYYKFTHICYASFACGVKLLVRKHFNYD